MNPNWNRPLVLHNMEEMTLASDAAARGADEKEPAFIPPFYVLLSSKRSGSFVNDVALKIWC